jgi:branched-chain amino acid transport system permease protein
VRRLGGQRSVATSVALLTIAGIFAIQMIFYGMPFGLWVESAVKGVLAAMLAIGMALIYRANRVVNFAQADLGTVPTGFAASFVLFWGWPYFLGMISGLVLAIVLGVVVEVAFIRRFRNSPRLVVTVATLGIAQLLLVLGILIPRWWGKNLASQRLAPPFDWKFTPTFQLQFWKPEAGGYILNANHLLALLIAPLAIAFVAWFLNRSRLGTAIRASAERSDRAAMLGIPVARLNTIVWAIAAALAYLALFLRSGITGVPLGYAAGLPALLVALAAMVIGRLERLPTIAFAAIAFTVLESGVTWNADSPLLSYPIMAAAMFVALLAQRPSTMRRDADAISSWRGAEEVRPLPAHLANHGWVPTVRAVLLASAVLGVVLLPSLLGVGNVIKASALVCVRHHRASRWSCSPVGPARSRSARWRSSASVPPWAPRHHVALAGGPHARAHRSVGRRCGGVRWWVSLRCVCAGSTSRSRRSPWRWPPSRGCSTIASSAGSPRPSSASNDRRCSGASTSTRPARLLRLSRVVVLGFVYLALRGIRRSRTGRVIIAMRENERAAQSFSVGVVRAKLTAFVISVPSPASAARCTHT